MEVPSRRFSWWRPTAPGRPFPNARISPGLCGKQHACLLLVLASQQSSQRSALRSAGCSAGAGPFVMVRTA